MAQRFPHPLQIEGIRVTGPSMLTFDQLVKSKNPMESAPAATPEPFKKVRRDILIGFICFLPGAFVLGN